MEKIKILVIDDNELEFHLLKELLSSGTEPDWEVDWESDAGKGLELLKGGTHKAYLVDYNLGQTKGSELVKKARKSGCIAPIILLTGQVGREVDLLAQESGADDYLFKGDLTFYHIEKSLRYAFERKRIEKEERSQQLRLSHSLKMSAIGELAGGIAHEINNPLAIIAGITSTLRMQLTQGAVDLDELENPLARIENMTFRISKIIKSIQTLSRNSELDAPEACNLRSLVEESAELCMGRVKHSGASLSIEGVDPTLEINCRPTEISQVMVNLICNSADAIADQASPWIRIHTEVSDKNVQIYVTDSGEGISKDLREKIHLPYFSTKENGKGTGLGLSISRMIVESHSGNLSVSEKSKNTQFICELPQSKSSQGTKTNRKILIVEDELEIRDFIAGAFERKGCEVIQAKNAEAAILALKDHSFQTIITDINLGGMSGLKLIDEVYQIFQGQSEKPKLVVISGYASPSFDTTLVVEHGLCFILKPMRMKELIQHAFDDSFKAGQGELPRTGT